MILAFILLTAGVLLSPLALKSLGGNDTDGWQLLSNIGQAYGATSAILSAFALIIVSYTSFSQIGESRSRRHESNRLMHFELVKLAMDDGTLRASWGEKEADPENLRKIIYTNLVVDYWFHQYRVNVISEDELAFHAHKFFSQQVAHDYWAQARPSWTPVFRNARERRFGELFDRMSATESPVSSSLVAPKQRDRLSSVRAWQPIKKGASGMAGVVLAVVLAHKAARIAGNRGSLNRWRASGHNRD